MFEILLASLLTILFLVLYLMFRAAYLLSIKRMVVRYDLSTKLNIQNSYNMLAYIKKSKITNQDLEEDTLTNAKREVLISKFTTELDALISENNPDYDYSLVNNAKESISKAMDDNTQLKIKLEQFNANLKWLSGKLIASLFHLKKMEV